MGQQTFSGRQQILNLACGTLGVLGHIKYGNLETDFCAMLSFRRKHDAVGGRVRMLTGFEQVERLKEDVAEPLQIAKDRPMFLIIV